MSTEGWAPVDTSGDPWTLPYGKGSGKSGQAGPFRLRALEGGGSSGFSRVLVRVTPQSRELVPGRGLHNAAVDISSQSELGYEIVPAGPGHVKIRRNEGIRRESLRLGVQMS